MVARNGPRHLHFSLQPFRRLELRAPLVSGVRLQEDHRMAPSRRSAAPFGEDVRSDLSLRAKRGRGAGEIGRGADVEDSDSGGSCGEDLGKDTESNTPIPC